MRGLAMCANRIGFMGYGARLVPALLLAGVTSVAQAAEGRLHANFYLQSDLKTNTLAAEYCDGKAVTRASSILAEAIVGLAGKVAGSLLDGIAAKFRAEAATLEARSSIDAFYKGKNPELSGACLVIHNGLHPAGTDASIIGVFQAEFSKDRTAWRLQAKRWVYTKFVIGDTRRWGQAANERDFALRVMLTKPGQAADGANASVLEHVLDGATLADIQQAFLKDEKLPWMAVPVAPGSEGLEDLTQPMNLRVTIVETTKPGQLANWMREATTESREATVALAKDLTRKALDPGYAAAESVKATTAASTAYGDYKTAWDAWAKISSEKPQQPANYLEDGNAKKLHDAAITAWEANVTAAKALSKAKGIAAAGSFSAAGLPWPGDLPEVGKPK